MQTDSYQLEMDLKKNGEMIDKSSICLADLR